MKRKFKVGDKCYIELTIKEIKENISYPIITQTDDVNEDLTFTLDGKIRVNNETPILKHIEELQPKSKYPKWMMISNDPITGENKGQKRFVVYRDETGVIAIDSGNDKCEYGACHWEYFEDIEENNELEELKKAYEELGEKIKQLEK